MVCRRQARLNGTAVATLLRGFADKPALQEEVAKKGVSGFRDLRRALTPKPQRWALTPGSKRVLESLNKGPGLRIGCRVGRVCDLWDLVGGFVGV